MVVFLMVGGTEILTQQEEEANAITVSRSGLIFEIQLGHFCNNRCAFCSSGYLTEVGVAQKIELNPILKAIKGGRDQGATKLIFLGGEPTLHDGFLEALAYSVEIGFEDIVIFTNGARMARPKFMDSCLALGNFEWRISIQGATEDVHDLTTGLKGAFGRIRTGLIALAARNQKVTTNMCVCTSNFESVVHFPELISQYNISQLHLDVVRPMSTPIDINGEDLSSVMPRHSAIAPYLREMLEGFAATNPTFDINVGNLPFCFLPEWGSRMEHGGEETITQPTSDVGLQDQMNKYEWHKAARIKNSSCESCIFDRRCTGVYREYAELYGTDELRPVSISELEEFDPEQRSFPLLASHWFHQLAAAVEDGVCLAGWRVESWEVDHRRRCIEMLMFSTSGGYAMLFLHPMKEPPRCPEDAWTLISGPRYIMRLQVGPGFSSSAVKDLLGWITEYTPAEERENIDCESFLDAFSYGGKIKSSVGRLVQALQFFQPEPKWACLAPVFSEDGLSAQLEYRKTLSDEIYLSLILKLYPIFEGERSRVGVKLDIPSATTKAESRPAAKRLIARIKSELSASH